MRELLDDLERGLTDLLQMGLATAGPDMALRLGTWAPGRKTRDSTPAGCSLPRSPAFCRNGPTAFSKRIGA